MMKNRILIYFLDVFFIFLVLSLVFNNSFRFDIDKVLLLEGWAPTYVKYLSGGTRQYMDRRFDSISYNKLVLGNGLMRRQQGVQITVNNDSSVTINGNNHGSNIVFCITTMSNLKDGDYLFSDGNISDEGKLFLYSEAWDTSDPDNIIKVNQTILPNKNIIHVDNKVYDTYWFGIWMAGGIEAKNVTFYPMLTNITERSLKFVPGWQELYYGEKEDMKTRINLIVPQNVTITDLDWLLFNRRLKFHVVEDEVYISYVDDTGALLKTIQYK